jgi:hypothetical protein
LWRIFTYIFESTQKSAFIILRAFRVSLHHTLKGFQNVQSQDVFKHQSELFNANLDLHTRANSDKIKRIAEEFNSYCLQLKVAFFQISKSHKKNIPKANPELET